MSEGLKHLKQYGTGAGAPGRVPPGRGGLWYRYTDSVSLTDDVLCCMLNTFTYRPVTVSTVKQFLQWCRQGVVVHLMYGPAAGYLV